MNEINLNYWPYIIALAFSWCVLVLAIIDFGSKDRLKEEIKRLKGL